MRKIILLALAIALISAPAFASVQNVKVSGEVDSTYVDRRGFDLGTAGISGDDGQSGDEIQNFFIIQTGLRVDADLTDNVSATVALINERTWGQQGLTNSEVVGGNTEGAAGDDESEISINLAYVTLREMLYSPLTVVVGRQSFRYGNSFIVDSAGPNNTAQLDSGLDDVAEDLSKQTAMDAVRLILDYDPLKVELLWAKIDDNVVSSAQSNALNDDDIDLYGINATYDLGDDMASVVEAYMFIQKDQTSKNATDGSKTDVVKVLGVRGSTNPNIFDITGLNLQAEVAHQGGTYNSGRNTGNGSAVNQSRNAWGVQFIANYQVPMFEEYKPVLQYIYTKVTGNSKNYSSSNNDEEYNAWDQMFENQASGKIYNALADLSGIIINEASLSAVPLEDILAKISYSKIWLEEPSIGTFVPNAVDRSSYSTNPTILAGKRQVGQEVDFDILYDYTEDVEISASLGLFYPGKAFTTTDPVKQFLLGLDVKF